MRKNVIFSCLLAVSILSSCATIQKKQAKVENRKPNIIIIYADDMGYGDLNIENPNSKIPTPNLDQLAREGMRFTDAHSSSGICTPSRFALLTGTYHWRNGHDIVQAFGKPFFKDTDITLPQVLRTNGYTTAAIGKWHLGWDWEFKKNQSGKVAEKGNTKKVYLPEDIDWSKPVSGGPLSRGFDYYFGDGTPNMPPYAWVENDRFVEAPTEVMDNSNIGHKTKEGSWEYRSGPKVKGWNPYEVLPTLTKKTVEWINKQDENKPFFLYLALPSPHAPIIPNDEFDGKSKAGGYGDYMVQTDFVAGQVLKALKEKGLENNTIIIFSSDNGTESYAWERAVKYGHFSMGDFRGVKRDVWEGGHHIPFIIKWPGKVKAGSISHETISQIDIMATLASITHTTLPETAAPDSYDLTPVIKGKRYKSPLREATIHNTYASKWGIRQGDWLFINDSTGGHRALPENFKKLTGYTDFDTPGILFNMKKDPEQRINLYNKYPKRVEEMNKLLNEYRKSTRTVKRLR